MKNLVSVVITTKNEAKVIKKLLETINGQSYKPIETLVVDNKSTDNTKRIAKQFTKLVYDKGPERSAQRNYGAKKAHGEYFLFLDADMELQEDVVKECVELVSNRKYSAVIIPEDTYGKGFWAKVKTFERSFYTYDKTVAAARFYPKNIFLKLGGFDESITGPEDWDLSGRAEKIGELGRTNAYIRHNEEELNFWKLLKKKYYYAKKTHRYLSKNNISAVSPKTIFFLRSSLYKDPKKIIKHPHLYIAMWLMLSAELIAGGIGYVSSKK